MRFSFSLSVSFPIPLAINLPSGASANAAELEAISGRPGSQMIPAEIAQQGMAAAAPTRSGLPMR